jgi:hypothetical protein
LCAPRFFYRFIILNLPGTNFYKMIYKISLSIIIVIFSIMGSLRAQNLNDSLAGYWPFNGNTDDESGNGNNGIVFGATLTSDRVGNLNSAYRFDGIDDYIVIKDTTLLNPGNISICCWYKTVSFEGAGNNPIIDKAYISHDSPHYQYHIGVTGDLYTYSTKKRFAADISIDSTDRRIHTEEYFWNVGEWYFLCLTCDGLNYKFYVNDVLIGDSIINGSIDNFNQDLYVGKFGNLPYYTPGVIDDIRIYSRALTAEEIDTLYNELKCFNLYSSDTCTYYVSNAEFQLISPRYLFTGTDTLKNDGGFCDSIVSRYEKYMYNPNYYTDTISHNDSISVTDTLIIDVHITDILPPDNINRIIVYPNPAKEYVIINTGKYNLMNNYSISIENVKGQIVFTTKIEQFEYQIDVNEFGGYGTYLIKVYDNHGTALETRKLILL